MLTKFESENLKVRGRLEILGIDWEVNIKKCLIENQLRECGMDIV
jgi:hypothetical protein